MHPIIRNSIINMYYINVIITVFTILVLAISLYFI